jgi:putative flippase GtrA
MIQAIRRKWKSFEDKHPNVAQFAMFFLLSNGVTVLQFALMPLLKAAFNTTSLVDTAFQIWPLGSNIDGSQYFIFDYPAGELPAGGGGLAYFLAVQITIAIAQIINFFAQRSITFRANNSVAKAATWYVIAYVLITIGAAAAQGFYKAPIYNLFIDSWGWGAGGETAADVITMTINSAIAFWIFFPIFKVIFKREPELETTDEFGEVDVNSADSKPDIVAP